MEKMYSVFVWCGSGYFLSRYDVNATCEEHALEIATVQIINEGAKGLYFTEDEATEICDCDPFEDESLIYVDATMDGAPYPVYLRSENLKIMQTPSDC